MLKKKKKTPLTAHEREKAAWDARKTAYHHLKNRASIPGIPGRTGAHVNKPWFIQLASGYERAADPEPMTRQVRRQNERRAV
jgi:hypothetical protein